jgi:hypothetical protein
MKEDTSASGRNNLKYYQFFKIAVTQIPEANKQPIAKHQNELQPLGSLGN